MPVLSSESCSAGLLLTQASTDICKKFVADKNSTEMQQYQSS